ncbi:hypothetical protein ACIA98_41895 [Streptomyces sp. NPDC051366]|uniref:hypothetical protein n=1 Tax=Streptomyces sp. NPDC051366 TaxID=3365652 RepID=UPI0037880A66
MATSLEASSPDPGKPGRRGPALERVTLNLTPRSAEALDRAVEITKDSKTDTINRAIQTYAYLMEAIEEGGSVHVRRSPGGDLETIHFL